MVTFIFYIFQIIYTKDYNSPAFSNEGDIEKALKFATHLALGIATGLTFIHRKGFLHRDMKPENILVCFCISQLYCSTPVHVCFNQSLLIWYIWVARKKRILSLLEWCSVHRYNLPFCQCSTMYVTGLLVMLGCLTLMEIWRIMHYDGVINFLVFK